MRYEIVDATYVLDNLELLPIVDVRPAQMWQAGHISHARSIELLAAKEASGDTAAVFAERFQHAGLHPRDRFIVYCHDGVLAREACDLLAQRGYAGQKCYAGSWRDWVSEPLRPIARPVALDCR